MEEQVMNLDTITEAVETQEREVEFRPAGKPTGWFFRLRHESAPEVQEVMRKFQAKVRDLMLKRKNSAYQRALAENEIELRVAHVAGWRWAAGDDAEAGRPPFSKRELKNVFDNPKLGYHVKAFIDEEIGNLEDFLLRSVNS